MPATPGGAPRTASADGPRSGCCVPAAVLLAFIVGTGSRRLVAQGLFRSVSAVRRLRRAPRGRARSPDNAITGSIVNAAPLLLAGLSVALGFKAGLFNIGATGQFVIGGPAACVVGAMLPMPRPWSPSPSPSQRGRHRRGLLWLHTRRSEGVHRCPRGGHHDHAQLHRRGRSGVGRPRAFARRFHLRPDRRHRQCRPTRCPRARPNTGVFIALAFVALPCGSSGGRRSALRSGLWGRTQAPRVMPA